MGEFINEVKLKAQTEYRAKLVLLLQSRSAELHTVRMLCEEVK